MRVVFRKGAPNATTVDVVSISRFAEMRPMWLWVTGCGVVVGGQFHRAANREDSRSE